jgi:O-antigen/teichoic acid export membrane protein
MDGPLNQESKLVTPVSNGLSNNSLRRQVVRGGATYLAARLVVQLLQLLLTLYVVRLLNPADYGQMATALVFIGLAELLAEAGLGRALIQVRSLQRSTLSQAFTLSLVLAMALYGVLWVLSGVIRARDAMDDFVTLLRVCAMVVLLVPFQSVASAMLERDLKYAHQSIVVVAMAIVQSSLIVGLAITGHGVWSLALGLLGARLTQAILTMYLAGFWPTLAVPTAEGGKLLHYGMIISAGTLLWYVYGNADVAIVSGMLGVVAAGYYSVALQIVMMPVDKVSAVVNQIAFATYCKLQAEPDRMRSLFRRLLVVRSLLATPALVGLALVAEDAVPLVIGEKWRPAIVLLQLLAPLGVAMIVGVSFSPLFYALGRPDIMLKYTMANAVVLPTAFFVGCKAGGAVGVCIASLVAYPLSIVVLIHGTRRLTGIGLAEIFSMLSSVMAALIFMAGMVSLGRHVMADETAHIRLAASIAVGVASYASWFWVFAPSDLKATVISVLRELVPRPRSRHHD